MGSSHGKQGSESEPVDPIQINPLGPLFAELFGVGTRLNNSRGGFELNSGLARGIANDTRYAGENNRSGETEYLPGFGPSWRAGRPPKQ